MIKNRIEPIPEKVVCDNCKEEYPFFDTIRRKKGRICMVCYCRDYGKMKKENLKWLYNWIDELDKIAEKAIIAPSPNWANYQNQMRKLEKYLKDEKGKINNKSTS